MRQIEELGLIKIATYHSFAPFLPVADTVEMRSLYEKNKAFTTWFAYAEKNTRLDADNKNEQQKFREAFREKFGHEPRPDAAYVYDDIKLLAKAIRPCLSDSRVNQECLSAELLKTSHFGPSGKLTFDEFGNSNREVLIMTVKSGAWTLH
jgi:ABC-type branched-subunit amino acid transport system substrate-binding protein